MRVAVTGASGLIGRALCARLAADGHDVLPLRRRERAGSDGEWDPPTGWVRPGGLSGVDAVVNLAGAPIAGGRWTARRMRTLRESRVPLTALLADWIAASKPRPRVLVSASAIGYYGDRGDELLDERAAPGRDFLATLAEAWEEAARRAESADARVVRLRIGHVLDGHDGLLGKLLPPFRLGLGTRFGNGRQWMSWIAIDDMVEVILRALTDDGFTGAVNAVAPAPATNAEFTRALAAALRRPAVLWAPAVALRVVLGREMADGTVLASQRVAPCALADAGFTYAHPDLAGALAAVLAA